MIKFTRQRCKVARERKSYYKIINEDRKFSQPIYPTYSYDTNSISKYFEKIANFFHRSYHFAFFSHLFGPYLSFFHFKDEPIRNYFQHFFREYNLTAEETEIFLKYYFSQPFSLHLSPWPA